METKEEIKKYIVKEMNRVKDFPDLNHRRNLSYNFYKEQLCELLIEINRCNVPLIRVWNQNIHSKAFIKTKMPDTVSELVLELKEKHNIDTYINIGRFVEYYTHYINLTELISISENLNEYR